MRPYALWQRLQRLRHAPLARVPVEDPSLLRDALIQVAVERALASPELTYLVAQEPYLAQVALDAVTLLSEAECLDISPEGLQRHLESRTGAAPISEVALDALCRAVTEGAARLESPQQLATERWPGAPSPALLELVSKAPPVLSREGPARWVRTASRLS